MSALNDTDTSIKTDISVVCNEENYEVRLASYRAGNSDGENYAAYGRPEPKIVFMYLSMWLIKKLVG